jgi:DnaK suppressor protein
MSKKQNAKTSVKSASAAGRKAQAVAKKQPAKSAASVAKPAGKPAAKPPAKTATPSKTGKTSAPKAFEKATKAKAPAKSAEVAKTLAASKAMAAKGVAAAKMPARTIAVSKSEQSKKAEGGQKKMAARAKVSEIVLPPDYRPSEDEPFMNEMHRAYFRKRLLEWKDEILRQTRETLAILHEDSTQHADLADRATSETDRATELRTRDRQRKLIAKIDAALARIEDGSYGYCEETGEPIGLKRLDARPIATLSVEAQERHERRERVYREE